MLGRREQVSQSIRRAPAARSPATNFKNADTLSCIVRSIIYSEPSMRLEEQRRFCAIVVVIIVVVVVVVATRVTINEATYQQWLPAAIDLAKRPLTS